MNKVHWDFSEMTSASSADNTIIYSSNQNIIDVARDMMDPPQYDMLSFLQGQRKPIRIFYILVENLMCINGCALLWILI